MKAKKRAVRPKQRASALKQIQDQKMARSAFDYVRGSTEKFYDWLGGIDKGTIPDGPPIWTCGDCHLGNLGPVANVEGKFEVEIRDFDQTVIGNPAFDLVRLGLSLASDATVSDLPGLTIADMLERMIHGYEMSFDPNFDQKRDLDQPKTISRLNKKAEAATWTTVAEQDIDNEKFVLPHGRAFWPLSAEERREINDLFATEEMRDLATRLPARKDGADMTVVDAAFWRKGCSSLGRLRYAVLLQIGSKSDDRHHCLMDVKEAVKARAPDKPRADMPRDPAERVVTGARCLSPYLGERMRAVRLMGKSVFVREVLPQDLKIEIDQLDRDEAKGVAGYLARVVGKAHGRQMEPAARKAWRAELQRSRSKSLEAPTWLWRSVVDLLSDHERAYLEHCRQYALTR
ncbi:MAG: DUF2252 family protein [Hyphomicrobiales bacterium]|nr:DUF2252 family protein [Hyphomicrobiales bacterium]